MKPYRLKHTPTGVYYQPCVHGRGSNLSLSGKVYLSKIHGLSRIWKYAEMHPNSPDRQRLTVFVYKYSRIYKQLKNKLNWEKSEYSCNQLKAFTNIYDWEMEEL